jgi:Calcium-binding EGF domain
MRVLITKTWYYVISDFKGVYLKLCLIDVFFFFADIDECTKYPSICARPKTCKNTPGSYECNCPESTSTDGSCYSNVSSQSRTTKLAIGKQLLPVM